MRTSVKNLVTICTLFIGFSALAQRNHNGNTSSSQSNSNPSPNNQPTDNRLWAYNHPGQNYGGGPKVNIHIGVGGGYYAPNYGYGYSNYYNVKKSARYSIQKSAQIIGQALQFNTWNDIYSPWLAKAIQHQQYAKQLYFWGDYAGALNHAERAGFLAWNTLNYFNNPYGAVGNAGYPNPYSDPNNPYYRQANPTGTNNSAESSGYRKSDASNNSTNATTNNQTLEQTELDRSLPKSKLNDKELLKVTAKDLNIE